MAIKNFWSLQVGEVVVADKLKKELGKKYVIFMPLDNQLKDIDLVLVNVKTKKLKTIQVKESREYTEFAGNGWINVNKNKVNKLVADFYIFVIYRRIEKRDKQKIQPEFLIIKSKILKERSKNKTPRGKKKDTFYYFLKIRDKEAFDDNEGKNKKIYFTDCLNNFNVLKI